MAQPYPALKKYLKAQEVGEVTLEDLERHAKTLYGAFKKQKFLDDLRDIAQQIDRYERDPRGEVVLNLLHHLPI